MTKGTWYAIAAYFTWGLFPVYWKWLREVPAVELIGHRILWSCAMLLALILIQRQWRPFLAAAGQRRILAIYGLAGALIAVNWLLYVWSLGYFINPLISVLLGVFVLGERLRLGQWIPVGIAGGGVLYLTWAYGTPPWIALTLAVTFGLYGLVKKAAPLGAVHGLALETVFLLIPAAAYLAYLENAGRGEFLHSGLVTNALLVGCGAVTTFPLILFAAAARRIPLTRIGLLQYLAPTLQFLLGVLVYKEPFSTNQLIGFAFVWTALALFAVEGTLAHRNSAAG
jgi:chloramphenicol-sensitive protein RarD